MDMWPVLEASGWRLAGEEPAGLQVHTWLAHPDYERTWLFKQRQPAEPGPFHEDLTEKAAAELGRRLGVPCATVELAQRHEQRGCLVEDLRLSNWQDQPGQVLLQPYAGVAEHLVNPGHSLENIRRALAGMEAPPQATHLETFGAFDVFSGYLVFDALIANTDRHDRNWAVLRRPPGQQGPDLLCGSFDHASSLGFNVTDCERARLLDVGGVGAWALRGRARQFERQRGAPKCTLVELAHQALEQCETHVREYWLGAVEEMSLESYAGVLRAVPELSDTAVTFTLELLLVNRGRLLDV